jgi:hypothetical protein
MADKKDEISWTKNSLLPLLRRLGWRRVDFVHGTMEAGRDIIMADYDRFGLLRYYAAQAKDGDLRATSESPEINTIIDQCRRYREWTQDRYFGTSWGRDQNTPLP